MSGVDGIGWESEERRSGTGDICVSSDMLELLSLGL